MSADSTEIWAKSSVGNASITVLLVENEDLARENVKHSLVRSCTEMGLESSQVCEVIEAHKNTPEEILQRVQSDERPVLLVLDIALDVDVQNMDRLLNPYVDIYSMRSAPGRHNQGVSRANNRADDREANARRRALIVHTKVREIERKYSDQDIPPIIIVPKYSKRGRDHRIELRAAFKKSLAYLLADVVVGDGNQWTGAENVSNASGEL